MRSGVELNQFLRIFLLIFGCPEKQTDSHEVVPLCVNDGNHSNVPVHLNIDTAMCMNRGLRLMNGCLDCTSFSTVFQSYEDNGWLLMKGCVQ